MKFISIRELRNRPGEIWKQLREDDLVLTANGRPRGVLVGLEDDELEETLEALRRARALTAVSRMRRRAAETGAAELPAGAIEAEVRAARRRRGRSGR